jgi:hypothetical protein
MVTKTGMAPNIAGKEDIEQKVAVWIELRTIVL